MALRWVRSVAIFGAGLVAGWALAVAGLHSRLRRQSLVLIDHRRPDMPLRAGVQHICAVRGGAARVSEAAALALIYDAAQRGKLSIWQRASSDTMRRISARQLRRGRPEMLTSPLDERRPHAREGRGFALLREEVELLWPRMQIVEGTLAPARVS